MKCKVYEEFVKGAKDGLKTVAGILPTLIGLMVAVGVLRASGFLEMLGKVLGQFTDCIGFPADLVPLTIVRMFSSSAATGLVLDIFPGIWYGFQDWPHCIHYDVLYGDNFLYCFSIYFIAAKVH